MGFFRRLLGGSRDEEAVEAPVDDAELEEDERAHELELARFDQARTGDLVRRQQRFASYSWTPPPEGGERRAGDEDAGGDPS